VVRAYCGIGSRSTPQAVLAEMFSLSRWELGDLGTLRTGGAEGADEAFRAGAAKYQAPCEIFLPWPGLNGIRSRGRTPNLEDGEANEHVYEQPSVGAFELASCHHPSWRSLTRGARALHARNCHQVLGWPLDEPASFVLCWTPDGAEVETTRETGGTGQAIRVAVAHGVPVVNMALPGWRERLEGLLYG
jgi:hypothetical protein